MCVQSWYTFVPKTVKEAHQWTRTCLHPDLHAGFDALAAREQKETKTHSLSTQLTITPGSVRVTKKPGAGEHFSVFVEGTRTMLVGAQVLREDVVRAEFTVAAFPEPGYPFGLVITGIERIQPKYSYAGD